MEDNEIIKALECCSVDSPLSRKCKICPNFKQTMGCSFRTMQDALDLINHQKAEIERLNISHFQFISDINAYKEKLKTAKSEAVKEFVYEILSPYAGKAYLNKRDLEIIVENLAKYY